ncbi:MAG: hypothetical protein M3T49_09430 [Candidatus Eremiobacteraeota bacterium]|nr:hypothetical protein [Candidatus Eremiobacteraeota bacterium]
MAHSLQSPPAILPQLHNMTRAGFAAARVQPARPLEEAGREPLRGPQRIGASPLTG